MASEPNTQQYQRLHARTRWLAIAASVTLGIAGFPYSGWYSFSFPSILFLGALVQPRSPRPGKWLLSLGAFFANFYGAFFGWQAVLAIPTLRRYHDFNIVAFTSLMVVSVLLVGCCDVALILDARRMKRISQTTDDSFPGVGDWIVWLVAAGLNVYVLSLWQGELFAFRHYHRWDLVLIYVMFALAGVGIDVAIVLRVFDMLRVKAGRAPSM